MKVLLLDVNCKYSSTGKIVYDLYRQLRAVGHEAAIGYGRGSLIKEENIYRFSPGWEVYMHALMTRLTGFTGCFSHIATNRLLKFIDRFQPDVVHLNDMHGYFVNIIPLIEYLKQKNIRTVWTFHCEFMYTGKCGHAYECEKWQTECGKCPRLNDYPRSVFFDHTRRMFRDKKRALEKFDNLVIVSPSVWLFNRIKKSFLRDKEIKVIYNGIDNDVFYKRDAALLKEKHGITKQKVVLAVAPDIMSANKGGRHVIALAEKMKNANVCFIMIGVTEKDLLVPDNVITIGLISDQDLLAQYYSMADVFLICSERENYPTTCIEAASCGTPIVGFDVGGTAETVDDECGIFVPYGNIDALKMGVEHFLQQSDEKKQLYNRRDYSKERMFQEYLQLYKEMSTN